MSTSYSKSSPSPIIPAVIFSAKKDPTTLQYVTRINLPNPPTNYVIDLGGNLLWTADCAKKPSYSFSPLACHLPQCSLVTSPFACTDNTSLCSALVDGPKESTTATLALATFSALSTNGFTTGPFSTTPNFLFACAPPSLLKGLAPGSHGIAAFSRGRAAIPLQVSAGINIRPTIALCLSPSSDGVIFVGGGIPYNFLPGVDAAQLLSYTPLLVNPVSTAGAYAKGEKSVEYFVGVKGIKVGGRDVPVNAALLAIDRRGNGGTKISTMTPYTVMETSIYQAVTGAFQGMVGGVANVAPVKPFKLCYAAKSFSSTRVGPGVPQIDVVLEGKDAVWSIFGANSMVEAKPGVLCWAFFDGGVKPRTSIVIGGYQLEDNLVQFDLKNRRFGFTGSLLFSRTTCGNFNFTGFGKP